MQTRPPPQRACSCLPATLAPIDKARSLLCDIVILDLEDAVAPGGKGYRKTAGGRGGHGPAASGGGKW